MIASRSRSPFERVAPAWPPAVRYGVALVLVLATTGAIALINHDWASLAHPAVTNPGTIYVATVTLAAVFLGIGPALTAIAASVLAVYLFFTVHESLPRVIVLLATMCIIAGLAEWQRRAQDTAEEAQAKLAAILESMSDAVMVVDGAGRATDVNHAAIAMLGASDHATALAKMMRRRGDGTPFTDEYGLLERALAGEDAPQVDVLIPRDGGEQRTVSAVASPIRDVRGQTIGAVSVSRDITERLAQARERERLLRQVEEEQRFTQHVLANVPVGIAVVRTDDFTVLSFNGEYDASIRNVPGGSPLLVGKSLLDAMPPTSHDAATRLLSLARDEQTTIRNTAYAAAVAPDRFYDGTIQPLHLGDGTEALLITAVDVTERVRGEQERERLLLAVERQAAQLAATFEAMVDGVAVYDAEGNVLHRNEAFYRLLHLEPGTAPPIWEAFIRAMNLRRADGTPMTPEDTHSFRALRGETIREEIVLVRDGLGRDRSMSQNAAPIRAADGTVIGAVVVFNDVTEQLAQEREREALLSLIEERRRFTQAIFDTVPVSLAVVDTDALTFQAANPAFLEGVPEPFRSHGVNDRPLTAVLPHTRENGFADQLRRVGATGEPYETAATRYAHPARGATYWNETMIPLVTSDPQAHHALYIAADVTQEIAAQQRIAALAQEAAERANQLEAVFSALTEGLVLSDVAGNIIRSNAALTRILGLDGEPVPPLNTFNERFRMRDDEGNIVPRAKGVALAALGGETATGQLRRFRNARGEDRWMSVSASPVRDETGAITGAVMMMRDVTEERQGILERERLLREVEQRERFTQAIFDSVPVGLMVVGVDDGIVRTANNAYARFIDETLTGADLAGRNAALLQPTGATTSPPEDTEEQYRAGLRTIAAGRSSVTIPEFSHPDYPGRGPTFWDVTGVPLFEADGTINDVLVVAVDTTDQTLSRRRIEELAETAAQRAAELEAIIANMPDGVAIYGADGRLVQMNAAGQRSAARDDETPSDSFAEAVERYAFRYPDGRPIPPDDLPLARALRGETVSGYEFVSETRRGPVYRLASSAPIRNAAGEITSAVVMFTDITTRKHEEQERERLLQEVEERRQFAQTVIESAPAGIVVIGADPDFTVRLANDRFVALAREQGQGGGVVGVPLAEVLPRAEASGLLPIFRRVVETGEPVSLSEFEYEAMAGRTLFLDWSLVPLREGGGQVTSLILLISDVTDRVLSRQRIEELADVAAQRASELEAIIANMPIGVAIHAADGRVVLMNTAGRQITGEEVSPDAPPPEIVDHFQMRYLDGGPIPLDDLPLARALRGEVVSEYEFIGRTRRGDAYFVSGSAPIRNAAGEITSAVVMFTDVTERHAAEQQREQLLQEIDERRRFVQTVIESASVGIAVFATDPESTVRIANDHYLRLLDEPWRSEGIIGRGMRDFVVPAAADNLLALNRQVVESREQIFLQEYAQIGLGAETAYVDWSLVPLIESGDRVTGVLSLVSDVTERVRSRRRIEELAWDAAQRASELETVITSIADGVMVSDASGRVILENDASRRLTGRARSAVSFDLATQVEAHDLRNADGAPIPPDDVPLGRAVRGETVTDQVLIVRRADTGEDRFLMCSSAPVRAGGGAITGAVAVFRDITEMKQLDQMKDEFISIAAHELRTPLTAIKGYAELLDRRLTVQGGRESDRKSLAVIRKQTDRLSGLVNEMLDTSRIEAGRLQLNSEPFDLSALVAEVVNNLRVSSETHTLSLSAEPGIEIFGDTARIEQVLINLISNAITYSPEGGEVGVRVWAEGDNALVSVRDQGVGIAREELPHVFDRFYRAPKAGIMRSGGMGLGLYISREIIARHGGTIRAESVEGAGSTFTFTLPLTRVASSE